VTIRFSGRYLLCTDRLREDDFKGEWLNQLLNVTAYSTIDAED
jgi:hypothetical protein